MARTVRDENIGSRNARLALVPRRKPYFRAIAQGLHVGYRRTRSGNGSWVARRYLGGERSRHAEPISRAMPPYRQFSPVP